MSDLEHLLQVGNYMLTLRDKDGNVLYQGPLSAKDYGEAFDIAYAFAKQFPGRKRMRIEPVEVPRD